MTVNFAPSETPKIDGQFCSSENPENDGQICSAEIGKILIGFAPRKSAVKNRVKAHQASEL
jgi:hypothetical protein